MTSRSTAAIEAEKSSLQDCTCVFGIICVVVFVIGIIALPLGLSTSWHPATCIVQSPGGYSEVVEQSSVRSIYQIKWKVLYANQDPPPYIQSADNAPGIVDSAEYYTDQDEVKEVISEYQTGNEYDCYIDCDNCQDDGKIYQASKIVWANDHNIWNFGVVLGTIAFILTGITLSVLGGIAWRYFSLEKQAQASP